MATAAPRSWDKLRRRASGDAVRDLFQNLMKKKIEDECDVEKPKNMTLESVLNYQINEFSNLFVEPAGPLLLILLIEFVDIEDGCETEELAEASGPVLIRKH